MKAGSHAPSSRLPVRLAGAFLGMCFLLPFLIAALNHFEGFAYANESIAYRWGHPSRTSMGDVPAILPQGFTILALQQYLVLGIEHFYPLSAETLRQSLQLFTWGTFLIFIVSFLSLLIAAVRNPQITSGNLCLVSLPWIAATYATGTVGWYYCLLPDYYHLNAIIACAVALLCFPFIQAIVNPLHARPGAIQIVGLGVLLGFGVANKITWAAPCFVAFGLVLLSGPAQPLRAVLRATLLVAAVGLTLVFVLFAYYRFNSGLVLPGVGEWLAFFQGQKGSVPLWGQEFRGMLARYNYGWLFTLEMVTTAGAVCLASGWRGRIGALLCLVGNVVLLWMVTQRPEGSTLWDINVLILMLTALAMMLQDRIWVRRTMIAVWGLAVSLLCVLNPPSRQLAAIQGSAPASTNRFDVFQEITRFANDRPQLIVFANNEYHHGGVHELLLKAAADFPTWNVTVGHKWLQRFGVDLTFLSEYTPSIGLPADLTNECVVWFDRPDLPLLANRYERLNQLARDPAYEVLTLPIYTLRQTNPPSVRVWVHAARLRRGPGFQSSFDQSSATAPLPVGKP